MILKLNSAKKNFLKKNNGIYKFYVNEKLLCKIKDILQLNFLDNRFIESLIIDDNFYYCVYVGKCNRNDGFFGRISKNHMNGKVDKSTLRKSLSGVLNLNKEELTKLLNDKNQCFFLVLPIKDLNNLEKIEIKCINSSIHILNLDDNDIYDSSNNPFKNSYDFTKSLTIFEDLRKKAHD